MAQGHGKDFYFNMDDTGGTPTDVSAYLDGCDGLPGEIEMADVTTATFEDHAYIAGLTAPVDVTLSGPYDSTFDALVGTTTQRKTARTCVYGPGGNATPKWTFEGFISRYVTPAVVTDAARMSLVIRVTGTITRS